MTFVVQQPILSPCLLIRFDRVCETISQVPPAFPDLPVQGSVVFYRPVVHDSHCLGTPCSVLGRITLVHGLVEF